jgi:hypothetical protein
MECVVPRRLIIVLSVIAAGVMDVRDAAAADTPKDRVLAIYFHRTERCPTCQKMGSYSEEAVKQRFAEQVKQGTVAFYFIDFEDAKNAKLVKGYKVDGPALIVAKIRDKKVEEYRNLEDIWTNVGDKAAFLEYVQENITTMLE